ncbi:MAG: addiction module toxin, RelE/StbE family [Firmicutes bacterium]|nr:addiction module toxin, RelE/StbE family [Bacillota bacterium]
MYKLLVSELAHQDLDNIVSYIAVQLANQKAAGDFLDEVAVCYGFLKDNPMMYERCQDRRLVIEGYRKVVIKNYVLVYKVDETSHTVNVMRFFYCAQDYIKLL